MTAEYKQQVQEANREAEARKKENEKYLDQIRGCLFGGAVGDALGYPVEFYRDREIRAKYGDQGITEYLLDPATGKALISDDTQMTLFTANGLLVGDTRGATRGVQGLPRMYVHLAYLDWLTTQEESYEEYQRRVAGSEEDQRSWLLDVPELFSRRAPGNTCLSALRTLRDENLFADSYREFALNDSKGCGGVMRVAPLALNYGSLESDLLDREGAEIAAITHSNSLGYMPAAVLVHIIRSLVFEHTNEHEVNLKSVVLDAKNAVRKLFQDDEQIDILTNLIDQAIALSENGKEDRVNIPILGEGWVAEETLAIAIYCALRHQDSFSDGVIAAVNHNGDSDSTGAVTGNILGALLGYDAIEAKWKENLELAEVILEVADDLCHKCQMSEWGLYFDPEWEMKYMEMHRAAKANEYTLFWKEDEENGCFSNWYLAPFIIGDFQYRWVEQYMMSQKAILFGDAVTNTKILRAHSPMECKDLGKEVTPYDEETWDAKRYEIVLRANRAKYEQHPELMEKLLETGDTILAEASPKDGVWGIKMSAEKARKVSPEQWKGENLLGKVLMELREEFRDKNSEKSGDEIDQKQMERINGKMEEGGYYPDWCVAHWRHSLLLNDYDYIIRVTEEECYRILYGSKMRLYCAQDWFSRSQNKYLILIDTTNKIISPLPAYTLAFGNQYNGNFPVRKLADHMPDLEGYRVLPVEFQDVRLTKKLYFQSAKDQEHTLGKVVCPEIPFIPSNDKLQNVQLYTDAVSYGPCPSAEDEVAQKITISRSGRVWFTSYLWNTGFGEFKVGRKMQLSIGAKAAEEILDVIRRYRNTPKDGYVTDIGDWEMKIKNADGDLFQDEGSNMGAGLDDGTDVSEFIRERVPIENLFLFDGKNEYSLSV